MSIKINIQSRVVDIGVDIPRQDDLFMVDSNVWYWYAYPNASISAASYQIKNYPNYLMKAISANSVITNVGLSLSELAHLIEQTERNIFGKSQNSGTDIKPKEYRYNYPTERERVVRTISAVWNQVSSISAPVDVTINDAMSSAALSRLKSQLLDGYDLFVLEAMKAEGISQVITDDRDFTTVPGIIVFTANINIIKMAKSQGKLLAR
jgi:predicted nucleic acid-binding protein